jgi:hypothetical protein
MAKKTLWQSTAPGHEKGTVPFIENGDIPDFHRYPDGRRFFTLPAREIHRNALL